MIYLRAGPSTPSHTNDWYNHLIRTVAIDSREALDRCCAAQPTLPAELPFIHDLGRVEEAFIRLYDAPIHPHPARSAIIVNPDLQLLDVAYSGLPLVLTDITHRPQPLRGPQLLVLLLR
jgi:hypothetical protein